MPNYELKALILEKMPICVDVVKQHKKACYLYETMQWDKITPELDEFCEIACELAQTNKIVFDECYRIVNADSSRRKRLRTRIEYMFTQGRVVFLTLTFSDEVLNNTIEQSRRDYVRKFLKNVSSIYVANVDYGANTGREHYHAVCVTDIDDFSSWTYGFYKALVVRKEESDAKRLATYISKLTNHAIKETTKRGALIYSRYTLNQFKN